MDGAKSAGLRLTREADGRIAIKRDDLELVIEADEESGGVLVLVFVRDETHRRRLLVTEDGVEIFQAASHPPGDVIEWEVM